LIRQVPEPSHVSASSQSVLEGSPQTLPAGLKPSAGQVVADPSQVSTASHWPFAARQVVPLGFRLLRHAPAPSQVSGSSQALLALLPQAVPPDLTLSLGQVLALPSQVSARSHPPAAAARQTVPAPTTASPGQVVTEPAQVSATSQPPATAGRQTKLLAL
jgi:hypothetical protein